jgi:hypothetical protein
VTSCPAKLVVVESDYQSTNIAVVSMEGDVLTGSLASSATAGFGGDVVPTTMPARGRVTLLERSRNDRIVWIDPTTTEVTELSVATGFPSDPYDYAQVAPGKAYVPRYLENTAAGQQPFDTGSDVLVVDPDRRVITGSIDMRPSVADAPGVQPRPNSVVTDGNRAFVLLSALTGFSTTTSSRLVEIDVGTDAVQSTLTLSGFSNCNSLEKSPFRAEAAALCSGQFNATGASELAGAGLVIVDLSAPPTIKASFPAARFGSSPIAYWAAYAAPDVLLFTTFGQLDDLQHSVVSDAVHRLDLVTGEHSVVLAGNAFALGGVVCEPRCAACFVTDAEPGLLHRFDLGGDGTLSNERSIVVERTIGLPPRDIGVWE